MARRSGGRRPVGRTGAQRRLPALRPGLDPATVERDWDGATDPRAGVSPRNRAAWRWARPGVEFLVELASIDRDPRGGDRAGRLDGGAPAHVRRPRRHRRRSRALLRRRQFGHVLAEVEAAKAEGDTIGGVVEVVAHGVHRDRIACRRPASGRPPRRRAHGRPGIKGVEVGDGWHARAREQLAHGEIAATGSPSAGSRIAPAAPRAA